MLSELFTSDSRAEIMRILFDGEGKEHYLREIEKLTHIQINSLQKEVKHLAKIDLIKARKDGNRIYYKANTENPIYSDLVSIVEKTVGIVSLLKEKLNDPKIECAFLFGSMATNREKATSDIDLIVIGDLGMRALTKLLSGLQEKLGREINPHIYTEDEFKKRIKSKDHFVTSVLKEVIKPVIGNVNEYR
ncbi:MAG: nucleotidyltransferase domain-containing protein [Bacteriovorax sp.]|nr:nucleotidyltransferase domain-containing protein [Bacteriovorax sp.]